MSEVRRGEDTRLERAVAIKLLRDDGDRRSIERFQQEAQILARLHHPNVVSVFDAGVDGDDRFIVMELVDGPTLRELLDDAGPLAPERAGEIASGLAAALGFAHGHHVVHRDVKPSNVLLPPDGRTKLVDMGIAGLLSQQALTMTLSAVGTARYMSPEQARGERLDGRSDIYSLGCVLFEMLTGRTPFQGNPVALSHAHVHTPAPRVRSVNPAAPVAMDELVAAMLEKDPARRPQTGEEVRSSLEAATTEPVEHATLVPPAAATETRALEAAIPSVAPLPTPPPPAEIRRRDPRFMPLLLLAGAVVLAIAWLVVGSPGGPEQRPSEGRPQDGGVDTSQRSSAGAQASTPEEAFDNLMAAIDAAGMSADSEDKVREQAFKLREHLLDGKTDDISKDAEEFLKELDERTEDGDLSAPGAETIRAALRAYLAAIDVPVPTLSEEDEDE